MNERDGGPLCSRSPFRYWYGWIVRQGMRLSWRQVFSARSFPCPFSVGTSPSFTHEASRRWLIVIFCCCTLTVISALHLQGQEQQQHTQKPFGPNPVQQSPQTGESETSDQQAATPQNSFEKTQQQFESQTLARQTEEENAQANQVQSQPPSMGNYTNIALWTAVIIGIIMVVFYVMKKFLPATRSFFSQPGIEVLSSSSLTKNGKIFLLQIGERIVRVGVSPNNMTFLGEVQDPDEVALIRSECKKESSFSKQFQEALEESTEQSRQQKRGQHRQEPSSGASEHPMGEIDKELSGIRKLLHSWKQEGQ